MGESKKAVIGRHAAERLSRSAAVEPKKEFLSGGADCWWNMNEKEKTCILVCTTVQSAVSFFLKYAFLERKEKQHWRQNEWQSQ